MLPRLLDEEYITVYSCSLSLIFQGIVVAISYEICVHFYEEIYQTEVIR